MKSKLKYVAILAFTCTFNSCDLDVIPPSNIAPETYWKNDIDAKNALAGIYAQLPGMDIWDEMFTDNAHSHKPWEGPFELVQTNGITPGEEFGYNYHTIRMVNTFLLNIDKCEMEDGLRERMKAEARFFRAWQYLELTNKFGKVTLFEDVPEYSAPHAIRNSVEEVQNYILKELGEIAEILPNKYEGSECYEKGRVTRSAALALRARAALYFGNFTEAEKSSGLVITEGHHSLFRVTSLNAAQEKEAKEMEQYVDFEEYALLGISKDKFVKGLFSYEALWHDANANPNNPEYVLTREYMADEYNDDWNRYAYIRPSQLITGYSSFEPMQDLIDAYWYIDGKTIPDKIQEVDRRAMFSDMWKSYFQLTSTDAEGNTSYRSCTPAEFCQIVPNLDIRNIPYMEEFRNRDSRLYASILFPLKGWHETDFGQGFYYQWDPLKVGIDGNESWTGYSYRKLASLFPYEGDNGVEDYPVIRYAEVLLTYAEARIQNVGWDHEAQSVLNDLRDRCGMPSVPISMSKEAGLEFVRNERRIELAAEGHRYEDMRRYGVEYCRKMMNSTTYAPCGGYDAQVGQWNSYVVIDKVWGDRLMLMPIPTAAIDVNPLLKDDQNDGY